MFEAVFTGKELAEYFGIKLSSIKVSAKKLGYKSGPYSLEEAKAIKVYVMQPHPHPHPHSKQVEKKQVFYRVSVKDFDGKCYVRHAGLTKKAARKMVELYAKEYLKAVAIPCNRKKK
jgi:hypothetical protein